MRNLFASLTLVCFSSVINAQVPGAKWVVPPVIDSVESLDLSPKSLEPWVVVKNKNLYGLYDRRGIRLLPVQYLGINPLAGGWLEAVIEGDAKPGVYNPKKRLLFNAQLQEVGRPYDRFNALASGYAVVYKEQLCGLINQKGEELVPVEYESVRINPGDCVFIKGNDSKTFALPAPRQHPELARIEAEKSRKVLANHVHIRKDGLSGFLNSKGDTVVPPLYHLGPIHAKGYILASFDKKTWGVIDARHNTLYPFTAIGKGAWTQSGLLPLRNEDKAWGLFRFPAAQEVIPFGAYDYIETYDAQKELFRVTKDKKVGLIDAKGAVILPLEYDYIREGDQITTDLGKNRLYGYWYRRANKLVEPQYQHIKNLNDSLIIVSKDTLWAVIDVKTGKQVIPFIPFNIEKAGPYFMTDVKYDPTFTNTEAGRLHGLYDRKGKVIFEPDSVNLYVFSDGSFYVAPHYKDSMDHSEQRSPDGKVIRTMSKIHDSVSFQKWFACSKNPEGKYVFSTFSPLDPPGKEIRYKKMGDLKENVRVMQTIEGKWAVVTQEGKILLPPVFDQLEPSQDGYIRAKYQGRWGVLQNPLFDFFEEMGKGQ